MASGAAHGPQRKNKMSQAPATDDDIAKIKEWLAENPDIDTYAEIDVLLARIDLRGGR